MRIRNLRAVPVLLRYSGFRKISICRKGLSETLPVALARSHNVIRDCARRVIELVYEEGEVDPATQLANNRRDQEEARGKLADEEKNKPVVPVKVDGIAERMLERLRMLKPTGVDAELARLRRMADMNPQMAPTVGLVVSTYQNEMRDKQAAAVKKQQQPPQPPQPPLVPPPAPAASEQPAPTKAAPKDRYTRTDVRKMRKEELVAMAVEVGVAGAATMDVLKLRCALLDRLPS